MNNAYRHIGVATNTRSTDMDDDIVIDEERTELKRKARRAYISLLESGKTPADVYRDAYVCIQDTDIATGYFPNSDTYPPALCGGLTVIAEEDLDPETLATIDAELRLRARENALERVR